MKRILNEHCHSQCESGLLLLSMPTGFGKTYNVLNFIYEHYEEFAAQERKILFVTNLKKNLQTVSNDINKLSQKIEKLIAAMDKPAKAKSAPTRAKSVKKAPVKKAKSAKKPVKTKSARKTSSKKKA